MNKKIIGGWIVTIVAAIIAGYQWGGSTASNNQTQTASQEQTVNPNQYFTFNMNGQETSGTAEDFQQMYLELQNENNELQKRLEEETQSKNEMTGKYNALQQENELLKNQLTEIVMPSTAASDAPISQNTDTPTYLVDLDWFDMDGEIVYVDETQNGTKDNLGNTYKNAICSNSRFTGFIIYKLDGKYSSFEGDFYQIYAKRSSDYKTTMVISVDDQVRFDETVTGGIDPIPILPIDVTGASELKISFSSSFNFAAYGALGDPKLY